VENSRRKLSLFLFLCHFATYSRPLYVELTLAQQTNQFFAYNQHAFDYFGARNTAMRVWLDTIDNVRESCAPIPARSI
jgi:hypothetical protein